jgi:hypothetical protein
MVPQFPKAWIMLAAYSTSSKSRWILGPHPAVDGLDGGPQ